MIFCNSLPNNKFLDRIKAFLGNKFKIAKIMIHVFYRVKNIVGNGENAGYQHFLLFTLCFKLHWPKASELLSWQCVCCVSVRPYFRKLFLHKTSPRKLLTGFLRHFTGMFLRWSSFKFL